MRSRSRSGRGMATTLGTRSLGRRKTGRLFDELSDRDKEDDPYRRRQDAFAEADTDRRRLRPGRDNGSRLRDIMAGGTGGTGGSRLRSLMNADRRSRLDDEE